MDKYIGKVILVVYPIQNDRDIDGLSEKERTEDIFPGFPRRASY